MGQLKLDGLGAVLVESNSVALVRTLFCQHVYPKIGSDKLERFQKQIGVVQVCK